MNSQYNENLEIWLLLTLLLAICGGMLALLRYVELPKQTMPTQYDEGEIFLFEPPYSPF